MGGLLLGEGSASGENGVGQSMALGKIMECLGSEKHCIWLAYAVHACGVIICIKLYGVHIDNGSEWQAKIVILYSCPYQQN